MNLVDEARKRFAGLFNDKGPAAVALAPGRVNLIGEHTDYNDGFVLPMAIDRFVAVAIRPRRDELFRAHSVVFDETCATETHAIAAPGGSGWFDYIAAVVWVLRQEGLSVPGVDLVITGDIPVGAGLASSAAVEMATARALCHLAAVDWRPDHMARSCQKAENHYVGVNCGIMDQFASALCVAGSALLIDCGTLEYELVSIPDSACFVVLDTGVRRSLASSEYNDRRISCEDAVAALQTTNPDVRSLRDVAPGALEEARHSMEAEVFKRAKHVVNEMERPLLMADALRAGDLGRVGRLMYESHESLRDLYEVSCPELDRITEFARAHGACFGARMTGAGFGGCAVALVDRDAADRFVRDVAAAYATASSNSAVYCCRPSSGATIV